MPSISRLIKGLVLVSKRGTRKMSQHCKKITFENIKTLPVVRKIMSKRHHV